jgi:hypothetical protein
MACGVAMGLELRRQTTNPLNGEDCNPWWEHRSPILYDAWLEYNPLKNRAQAMDVLQKFQMGVLYEGESVRVESYGGAYRVDDEKANLLRCIVTCAVLCVMEGK